jgi:hypothetical protein
MGIWETEDSFKNIRALKAGIHIGSYEAYAFWEGLTFKKRA